jgi:hypothetical protein
MKVHSVLGSGFQEILILKQNYLADSKEQSYHPAILRILI